MKLLVKSIQRRTLGVRVFELVDPEGRQLASAPAGSHVEVVTPGGHVRAYSLCGDPADTSRYLIAVLRKSAGRGGSKSLHDRVALGQLLEVSAPRNHFVLDERGEYWRLIGGGIGVTPLLGMAYRLHQLRQPFEFHYCVRSRDALIFLKELESLAAGKLHVHISEEDGRFVPAQWLRKRSPGERVYCCGPQGLMEAVRVETAHWPAGTVCFEPFEAAIPPETGEFEVELARSKAVIPVGKRESILVALWRSNHRVPSSCEVGICGTCRVRCLSGEPEHRDTLLTDEERSRDILVCVSRARSKRLVLDI